MSGRLRLAAQTRGRRGGRRAARTARLEGRRGERRPGDCGARGWGAPAGSRLHASSPERVRRARARLDARPGRRLNLWASWCIPCKEETPLLQRSWRRWKGRGAVFVGINAKDLRADARAFLRRYGVTYPNVYDGKGSILGRYGVTGFPETYFLDGWGRVVYRIVGAIRTPAELDAAIERALAPA
ncbi:MAG: TlpA family protein disulfide reductase [Gaiellaceae bacterium]